MSRFLLVCFLYLLTHLLHFLGFLRCCHLWVLCWGNPIMLVLSSRRLSTTNYNVFLCLVTSRFVSVTIHLPCVTFLVNIVHLNLTVGPSFLRFFFPCMILMQSYLYNLVYYIVFFGKKSTFFCLFS